MKMTHIAEMLLKVALKHKISNQNHQVERGHPQSAIKIYFRLTNGLVSNYEYSNGDGHVTNSIEPVDDAVAVILWIALRTEVAR